MKDERPFICRKILGLRPGQWLIVIGLTMIVTAHLVTGTPLRRGQWLMIVGGILMVGASMMRS